MICAISGSQPEEPVISIKTGNVYEKRLIEKYIDANGKEPTTGEPLSLSDLITVKIGKTVKPRPTTATSIPSMLQLFQNEWDSLMLETFTLKQQHENVRQELAHSMYQYDAACRVIARLVKERDAARFALSNARNIVHNNNNTNNTNNTSKDIEMSSDDSSNSNNGVSSVNNNSSNDSLDSAIYNKIVEKSQELFKTRKDRKHPMLPDTETLIKYEAVLQVPTTGLINSLDISLRDNNLIAMGSSNGNVYVYNRDSNETVTAIKSTANNSVTKVLFTPNNTIVSATTDNLIKVATTASTAAKPQYKTAYTFSQHKSTITDMSVHALGSYVISSSLDKTCNMYDIVNGNLLVSYGGSSTNSGFTSVQFHPDGMFFAAGTQNSIVKTYDIKSKVNNFNFQGLSSSIQSISFSENGYYLVAADNNTVKLYDLRKASSKPSPDIQTITLDDKQAIVKSINFDYSSQYLGIASTSSINLYNVKSKSKPPVTHIHSVNSDCLDFKWSKPNSNCFVTSSSSQNIVNIFQLPN